VTVAAPILYITASVMSLTRPLTSQRPLRFRMVLVTKDRVGQSSPLK
jgi:hypothetical protein